MKGDSRDLPTMAKEGWSNFNLSWPYSLSLENSLGESISSYAQNKFVVRLCFANYIAK